MKNESKGYQTVPFPAARKLIVDAGRLAARRHIFYALLELDVTGPRKAMADHKEKTGEKLSFTGFIVTCLAHAIDQNRIVQAYLDARNRLVIFEDVDVVTMIETQKGGVALPHVIRAANRKTFAETHDEIRRVQSSPESSSQSGGMIRLAERVPFWVRDIFYWALRKNPHWFKQAQGTTIVTSVGMFGSGAGWGITFLPYHTLGLTVGGIATRAGVCDGRIEPREFLDVTLSFDHDIVDGAPAARFAQAFKSLVESGYSLDSAINVEREDDSDLGSAI